MGWWKGILTPRHRLENGIPITWKYVNRVLSANIGNYLLPGTFPLTSAYFFTYPKTSHIGEKNLRRVKRYLLEHKITMEELFEPVITELQRPITEDGICWTAEDWKERLTDNGDKPRWTELMRALRVALAGGEPGPLLGEVMEIIGRDRALERVEKLIRNEG